MFAEKYEPLCRKDFRLPGVLSVYLFEQKQYTMVVFSALDLLIVTEKDELTSRS